MLNITLIILIVSSLLISISVSYVMYFIQKEAKASITILTTPKPPLTGIPSYLQYKDCIATYNTFIKVQFQRIYTTEVLPNLRNSKGQVSKLVPDDKTYSALIPSMVLQIYALLPPYLKKSIYFYFDIKDDKDESQLVILTEYTVSQVKALLDNHLIKMAEYIEKHGNSADVILDAMNDYSKSIYGIKDNQMVGPDGSKLQVMDD